jgi:predicted NodU family carbamoyl transferase
LKEANIDDPRSCKDEVWSYWPKVDIGQIFSFVLSRKEHDIDFVRHYKTQKAYSYYQSGFDDTIYCTSLNGTKVVKSSVSTSEYKK